MGSFFSHILGTSVAEEVVVSESSSAAIQTFHSSQSWQLHFDNSKLSSQLVVIDFSASWCGPCTFMEPAMKYLANKYTNVSFVKIDVDELSSVATKFDVQAMPTFVLLKKGEEMERIVGAKKAELEKAILNYM